MALPVTPPYVFGNVTSSIPLTNLDADFATIYAAVNGIGNGTVSLANVSITGGTISNVSETATSYVATKVISTSSNIGAYSYGTLSYSDVNIFESFAASANTYVQNILQNTNAGTAASTDYVVSNNLGTATTYYGNFGMNGSGWTGTAGTNSFNAPNMVYVTSTTGDLLLGTTTANPIRFATNGGADAMYIDTSGNVGIGTASPSYKLDVSGGSGTNARFTNGSNSLLVYNGSTTRAYIAAEAAVNNAISLDSTNSLIQLYTSGAERMRIDSSGNLLVGNSIPVSSSVAGFQVSVGDHTIRNSVGSTANTTQVYFYNPNGIIGSITTSGSATAYNTSSDYRLKENVAPMQNALNVVQQLKPVTYTWKVDGASGQGFIAHELQAVVPDCVTGEKDAVDSEGNPKYQSIDTSFLVATLTAAIQEQQALITDLQARLTKAGL